MMMKSGSAQIRFSFIGIQTPDQTGGQQNDTLIAVGSGCLKAAPSPLVYSGSVSAVFSTVVPQGLESVIPNYVKM